MHVRMLLDYRRPVELGPELVQSTDQALHALALLVSALLITRL
ncbi:hypothetical protein BX285_6976 [Streptomyces sp. 1114.5]|nr:hypothetical protein BX285_6976 [Streptomyces sp. 1114.5]